MLVSVMSYIDTKYLNIISPYLQTVSRRRAIIYGIFVAPIVGIPRNHAPKQEDLSSVRRMICSLSVIIVVLGHLLVILVKTIDSKTYKDYIFERYKKGVETRSSPQPEFHFNAPVFRKKGILKGLQSIKDLPNTPAQIMLRKDLYHPSHSRLISMRVIL